MPGCIVSATTASFRSVEKRRRRATPVITSTFENVSDIGVCLGLSLGPPAIAGVRSKRGAVQESTAKLRRTSNHIMISNRDGCDRKRGQRFRSIARCSAQQRFSSSECYSGLHIVDSSRDQGAHAEHC